jgi:hypothetical protein
MRRFLHLSRLLACNRRHKPSISFDWKPVGHLGQSFWISSERSFRRTLEHAFVQPLG